MIINKIDQYVRRSSDVVLQIKGFNEVYPAFVEKGGGHIQEKREDRKREEKKANNVEG